MRSWIAAFALCAMFACEGHGTDRIVSSPTSSLPSVVAPSSTPTAPMPKAGNCRTADVSRSRIVASRRGSIVLLRPSDGRQICTLVTIDQAKDTIITLSLSPDGTSVFFAETGFARCARTFAVDVPTARVRTVVDGGYAPAVSPDGRYLAYNASFSCGGRRHRIVVRDLKTGSEREWVGDRELGYGDKIVWAPDPRYLIISESGADSAQYFLLDTRATGALAGPPWPVIDDRKAPRVSGRALSDLGVSLTGATVNPTSKKVFFGVWYSDSQESEERPIVEFDPTSGAFRILIADALGPIDFDPTGTQLLYRGPASGFFLMRYSGGKSVPLGGGYFDAAW